MDYNLNEILRINREYNKLDDWLYNRIEEIGKALGFINKTWGLNSYEINEKNNTVDVTTLDMLWDGYDYEHHSFDLNLLCDENWEEKVRQIREDEKAKALIEKQEKENREQEEKQKKEYDEFIRLSEKFKNKEIKI